ncbi:hypothetical protein KEM48_009799 [Puccinia striiformis f. sp. tritici PST-130]|nr:hypothetical protein Pst134EB_026134 [Puccinia striiformis f. sp. tritici]KAI9627500.1 hypothetical protein KEM48_009799 [Puccinia striiformis f. sp. tritici PST-130]
MFLQIGALVVYGALLILVTGTTAAYPRARLARRMISSAADTTKELTSAKGGKIFTNSYLDKHMAAPGEPGLTLMEFHEHAGRQIGVDSKDMDRFVNSLISKSMPEEYKSEQFKLQDIYEDHLKWLKSKDNGVEASKALFKKMAGTPADEKEMKMSLNNYYTKMMDGKDIDHSEGMKFLEWKLTQKWRSQYEDTIKLNTRDLLKGFMRWASKDLKLKDNIYVHEWQNGMLETGSRRKLLEGLEPTSWPRNKITKTELTGSPENEANLQTQLKKPWWHLRNILDKIGSIWKTVIGRPVNKPPGTAL